MADLAPAFPSMRGNWTAGSTLPGGDLGGTTIEELVASLAAARPGLDCQYIRRLVRRHGALTADVLGDATRMADLGAHVGGALYGREVAYLAGQEWAREPDDVLWRRTRTGLHLTPVEQPAAHDIIAGLL